MDVAYSLKERLDSCDSFDVVSFNDLEEDLADDVKSVGSDEQEGEWEEVEASEDGPESPEVIKEEGFEEAMKMAMAVETVAFQPQSKEMDHATESSRSEENNSEDLLHHSGPTVPIQAEESEPVSPPIVRRRSAREALRDFYLARAKVSEEKSKRYRHYSPPGNQTETGVMPIKIAPLKAPERYSVDVIERVIREENTRKARVALRAFYAQRDAERTSRAALNRAREAQVYRSQIGSGVLAASCSPLTNNWSSVHLKTAETS
ncbi:hypothetical protein Poli38472_010578 [Pythium oligandrum]|uniref:Uncharacterized protein n=1 Tax=Pythium oligandrum TaxID=41045 RepID=A0A8K1FB33_PYTOL|nr:hypothetical protein Poli38472_010578 [Pythium oligandrum]|eukprot:TMW55696.1 hypothetical protein Poli38472_010578 [Pythium oligandrum]